MIFVKSLTKYYKNRLILKLNNINLNESSIVGIFGKNGCGKSTFFKCLTNLTPFNGEIFYNGINILKNPNVFKQFGILIEDFALINSISALDNLKYFLNNTAYALKLCNELDIQDYLHNKVSTFSNGMKQKLAFIIACSAGQKVILLDEPFNSLDRSSIKKCINILKNRKNEGALILIASHQLSELNDIVDYSYYLDKTNLKLIDMHDKIEKYYVFKFKNESIAQKAMIHISINYLACIINDSIYIKIRKNDLFDEIIDHFNNFELIAYEEIPEYEAIMEGFDV